MLGSLTYTLRADSWQNPGNFVTSSFTTHDSSGNPVGINGCASLSFNPSLSVAVGNSAADSPTALSVDLHVPRRPTSGRARDPAVKNAVVTLPAGHPAQPIGGRWPPGLLAGSVRRDKRRRADVSGRVENRDSRNRLADLARSSDGSIFLAQQHNNPFGSNFAMYVATEADGT